MTADAREHLVGRGCDSPIGTLHLLAGPFGLRAVLWPDADGSRVGLARCGDPVDARVGRLDQPSGRGGPAPAMAGALAEVDQAEAVGRAEAVLDQAEIQLGEYFAGTRRHFDLRLDPRGTAFQRSAWAYLRTIAFGSTVSYAQQAAGLGDPRKARAVGAANGRNPLSIVVPCHRVVASGGGLTGFAGGLPAKAWLLEHERLVLATS